ncbi:ion channel protein [Toxoplasma gondii GT1]|uniref:Ion channel protein n=2 Tax=Toxoplasma gondii TaxID=5811 RepID=S7V466_TOXGG|nr:ion channel protein [Toxoplasma gondii GT1]KAF4642052.1 ion channel protein [Toxoplasma gondii]
MESPKRESSRPPGNPGAVQVPVSSSSGPGYPTSAFSDAVTHQGEFAGPPPFFHSPPTRAESRRGAAPSQPALSPSGFAGLHAPPGPPPSAVSSASPQDGASGFAASRVGDGGSFVKRSKSTFVQGAPLSGSGGPGGELELLEQPPRPQAPQQSPFAVDIDLFEMPDIKKRGRRRRVLQLLWTHGLFCLGRLLVFAFAFFLIYCTIADLGRYRWLSLVVAIPIELVMLVLCQLLLKLPAWKRYFERMITEKLLHFSHQIEQQQIGPQHMQSSRLPSEPTPGGGVDGDDGPAKGQQAGEDGDETGKKPTENGHSRVHFRRGVSHWGSKLAVNVEDEHGEQSSTSDADLVERSRYSRSRATGSDTSNRLHSAPDGSHAPVLDRLGRASTVSAPERDGRGGATEGSKPDGSPSRSRKGSKGSGKSPHHESDATSESSTPWRRLFRRTKVARLERGRTMDAGAHPGKAQGTAGRVGSLPALESEKGRCNMQPCKGRADRFQASSVGDVRAEAGLEGENLRAPGKVPWNGEQPLYAGGASERQGDASRDLRHEGSSGGSAPRGCYELPHSAAVDPSVAPVPQVGRRSVTPMARLPGRAFSPGTPVATYRGRSVGHRDSPYLSRFASDDLSNLWITYRNRPPATRGPNLRTLAGAPPVSGRLYLNYYSQGRPGRYRQVRGAWGPEGRLPGSGPDAIGRYGTGTHLKGVTSCVDLRMATEPMGKDPLPEMARWSTADGHAEERTDSECRPARVADLFRLRSVSRGVGQWPRSGGDALQCRRNWGPLRLPQRFGSGVNGREDMNYILEDPDDEMHSDGSDRNTTRLRRRSTLPWPGAHPLLDDQDRHSLFGVPVGRGYSLGGAESLLRHRRAGSGSRRHHDWTSRIRLLMLDEDDSLVDEQSLYEVDEMDAPGAEDNEGRYLKGKAVPRTRREALAAWWQDQKDCCLLCFRCMLVVFDSLAGPAVGSSAFLLAVLLRTMAWCAVWVWASTLMTREPENKDLFAWEFDRLPQAYYLVESTFLWMVTFDYCAGLFNAPRKLQFVLSPYSIVDLLTMPMTSFIVNCFVDDQQLGLAAPDGPWAADGSEYAAPAKRHSQLHAATHDQFPWLLLFGWLRFLRLVKTEHVLSRCFPHLSVVKLRILSIVVSWLMIVLTFAGGMFVLEAPEPHINYTNVYDFCFYAIVTVMTVGYGDFVPRSAAGRALAIITIISTFAFLPGEVQRLMEALREPRTMVGSPPAPGDDYLCMVGPIQPRQLAVICREIARAFPGSVQAILVITPLPVSAYDDICFFSLSVCIRGGVRGEPLPSNIRSYCSNARAVFIFSNTRAYQRSPGDPGGPPGPSWIEGVETREQEEDHMTLLRFMGVRTVCFPVRPINVQLIHDHRKALVKEMGAYSTLCINEVKMKLLGKSCADCPGFVSMIANWFTFWRASEETTGIAWAASRAKAAAAASMRPTRKTDFQHYADGAVYNIYRMEFPECMLGVHYKLLTRLLYTHYEVFLIGIIAITKEIWINPFRYFVGEELVNGYTTWPFAGIVLAPSLETVVKLSTLRELPVKVPRAPCFSGPAGSPSGYHGGSACTARSTLLAREGQAAKRMWTAARSHVAEGVKQGIRATEKARATLRGGDHPDPFATNSANDADPRGGDAPVSGDGLAPSRAGSGQPGAHGGSVAGDFYSSPAGTSSHCGFPGQGSPGPSPSFSSASCFGSSYALPASACGAAGASGAAPSALGVSSTSATGFAASPGGFGGTSPSPGPLCAHHRRQLAGGSAACESFASAPAAQASPVGFSASPYKPETTHGSPSPGSGASDFGAAARGDRPKAGACVMCQNEAKGFSFDSMALSQQSLPGHSFAFSYGCDLHGSRRPAFGGIIQTQSVAEARRTIFAKPGNPVILACGWPRGLRIFVQTLLANGSYNVVILSPHCPATVGPTDFAAYTTSCAYVRGSALSTTDLLRAGALQAKNCAVFSTLHVAWKADVSAARLDTQALLVRKTIQALFRAFPVKNQDQAMAAAAAGAAESDAHFQESGEHPDDFDRQPPPGPAERPAPRLHAGEAPYQGTGGPKLGGLSGAALPGPGTEPGVPGTPPRRMTDGDWGTMAGKSKALASRHSGVESEGLPRSTASQGSVVGGCSAAASGETLREPIPDSVRDTRANDLPAHVLQAVAHHTAPAAACWEEQETTGIVRYCPRQGTEGSASELEEGGAGGASWTSGLQAAKHREVRIKVSASERVHGDGPPRQGGEPTQVIGGPAQVHGSRLQSEEVCLVSPRSEFLSSLSFPPRCFSPVYSPAESDSVEESPESWARCGPVPEPAHRLPRLTTRLHSVELMERRSSEGSPHSRTRPSPYSLHSPSRVRDLLRDSRTPLVTPRSRSVSRDDAGNSSRFATAPWHLAPPPALAVPPGDEGNLPLSPQATSNVSGVSVPPSACGREDSPVAAKPGSKESLSPGANERNEEQWKHQSALQHELEQLLEDQSFQSQLRQQPNPPQSNVNLRPVGAYPYGPHAATSARAPPTGPLDPALASSVSLRLPVCAPGPASGTPPGAGGSVPAGQAPGAGGLAQPQTGDADATFFPLASFPSPANPVAPFPVVPSASSTFETSGGGGSRPGSSADPSGEKNDGRGWCIVPSEYVRGGPQAPAMMATGKGSTGSVGMAPNAVETQAHNGDLEDRTKGGGPTRCWMPQREREGEKGHAGVGSHPYQYPPPHSPSGISDAGDLVQQRSGADGAFLHGDGGGGASGGGTADAGEGGWSARDAGEMKTFLDEKARKEPGIFLDLKEGSFLEYCDNSMVMNEAFVYERIDSYRRLWVHDKKEMTAAYLGSLLFASGHACVEDMFYGLMAHTLPVSKYAVDASVIDYLVEDRKGFVSEQKRLQRALTRYAGGPNSLSSPSTSPTPSPLGLEAVPPMFVGVPFKRLFEHLIKLEKKIAIGIYRQYRVTTDYAGHRRPKKLVLCCPSPHLRLTAFDKVYVLRPSSTDALRQPRAFL